MKVVARGPKRAFALAAVLSLSALLLVASGSAAPAPESADTEGLVGPVWTPVGLRGGETTVVLQLSGDPVALVQAAKGRKLSKGEKQAVKSQLKATQDGLRGGIARLGGTVLADYQVAYNGIKVRVDRSKLADLAELPGVTAVRALQVMKPDNVRGVPLIGAPAVWDGLAGLHGEGIKVAVIDTGIDYTHANFAGPGTVAAYNAANAADTLPPSPALGWGLRVKGGWDFVGDDYDADPSSDTYQPVPKPDPNPLDCNGHGSHVSGTAGGSGVLANGTTYTGPYNASTISSNSWTIGPGVAPKVDLYGLRVFGCLGSTDVTVDAIEWAVDNDMDVINMSLGSPFGSKDEPSAVASTNAAKAGVIVVTSAGNNGPNQYITGSPGTGAGSIATAASDPTPTFPGVNITAGTLTIPGINANEHPNPAVSGSLKVIQDNPATPVNEAEGCSIAAFGGPLPAEHDRGRQPWHLRPRGEGDLRPAGRSSRRDHGQQRGRFPAARRPDHVEPRRRCSVQRHDPVHRGQGACNDGDLGRCEAQGRSERHRDLDDPDVAHEPVLQGVRELLVGRSAHGRQRPEAGHHRSGRVDRLDRQRHRQQGRDDLRHVDGFSARRGGRGAHASGASDLDGRGHQGSDREHGRPGAGRRLSHESRWYRARPAAEVDHDSGRGEGKRRRVRGLGQLRLRGAAGRLLEDARDHTEEQRQHGGHVRRRAGESDHEHGALRRAQRAVGDRPRRWNRHGQRDAERRGCRQWRVRLRVSRSARSAA